MRTRTTTYFDYYDDAIWQTRGSSCGSFTDTNYPGRQWSYQTITDCVTPGYYRTISRGGVLPYLPVVISKYSDTSTPNSAVGTKVSGTGQCVRYQGQWYPNATYFNNVSALPSKDDAAITNVMNAAIAEAKAEAFDALTFALELEKTSRLIAGRVSSLFGMAFIAARRSRAPRNNKSFDELWLEMRYGWRPLVYDVSNACRQLRDSIHFRSTGRASYTVDLAESFGTKSTVAGSATWQGSCARTGSRTYRGFALYDGSFGAAPEFRPFQTAWELLPFSFLIDWFFDVGSWIAAVTPIPGLEARASGYSVQTSNTVTYLLDAVLTTGVTDYTLTGNVTAIRTVNEENYERFPSGASIPSLFPRLDTLKLVDILALLVQKYRTLRRFL